MPKYKGRPELTQADEHERHQSVPRSRRTALVRRVEAAHLRIEVAHEEELEVSPSRRHFGLDPRYRRRRKAAVLSGAVTTLVFLAGCNMGSYSSQLNQAAQDAAHTSSVPGPTTSSPTAQAPDNAPLPDSPSPTSTTTATTAPNLDDTSTSGSPGAPTTTPSLANAINVETLGAKGDGVTDDTAAIQQALNAGAAQDRPVYLPAGTYVVSGRRGEFAAILTFQSNTSVVGDGDQSIIKVADDEAAAGDYRIFAPASTAPTDNVFFSKMKIDGNGAHNLQPAGGSIRRAYGIDVDSGSNITVEDCFFESMPGPNVIVFGNNTSPASVQNSHIVSNRFHNVGGALPGNRNQPDHSTIYSQSDGGLIQDNTLWNDKPVDPNASSTVVVTALEVHGSHTLVTGNTVTNYTAGGNAAATVVNSIGNTWTNNTFENLTNLGINIWDYAPFTNKDLTISGNKIGLYAGFASEIAGIYQDHYAASTTADVQDLTIKDNTIAMQTAAPEAIVDHGIRLTAADGVSITGNTIKNFQGDGINFEPHASLNLDIRNVEISGNKVVDVGLSTFANRLWGVHINWDVGGRTIANVHIHDNQFRKDVSPHMEGVRIEGVGAVENVTVDPDNTFTNIPTDQQVQQLATAP